MSSDRFVQQRQRTEDETATQQLNAIRQLFDARLATLIPVVMAELRVQKFPNAPRDIFCLGQYQVNDDLKQGYYLGGHGADFTDLILCTDGMLAFGGKVVDVDALATTHKFTEHDTLDVIDKLSRMLEYAPQPPKKKRLFRRIL